MASELFKVENIDNIPNSTTDIADEPDFDAQFNPIITALRTAFVALSLLLIITGNIFSLVVLKSIDSLRFPPSTKIFLYNVILADAVYGSFGLLLIAPAALNYWPYGDLFCTVSHAIESGLCCCCANAAVLITLDRVLAIVYPLRHVVMIPKRRAQIIVLAVSTFSIIFTVSIFVGVKVTYNNNAILCLVRWSNGTSPYLIRLVFSATVSCFIPFLLLIACHVKLCLVAQKHAVRHAKLATRNNTDSDNGHLAAGGHKVVNTRALKMCTLLLATFGIAWTPYYVVAFRNYIVKKEASSLVDFVTCWICFCNCWWDVMVYFYVCAEFRKSARKILCRRRRLKTSGSEAVRN